MRLRADGPALGLLCAGVGLMGWAAWPLERRSWAGHTDAVQAVLQGREPDVIWTQLPPVARGLAELVALLPTPETAWLAMQASLGAALVFACALLALHAGGRRAALVTALLLALDPDRLAWSHAAYHVIGPAAAVGAAAWATWRAADRGSKAWGAVALAALLLAVAWRPDALLATPILVGIAAAASRRIGAAAAAIAGALAGLAWLLGRDTLQSIQGWTLSEALPMVGAAMLTPEVWGAWGGALGLPLLLLVVATPRRWWPLLAGLLLAWLALASFIDVAPRHHLLQRGGLALLAGVAVGDGPFTGGSGVGRRRAAWAAVGGLLLVSVVLSVRMRSDWYGDAGARRFVELTAARPALDSRMGPCLILTDDATALPPGDAHRLLDPMDLLDPLQAAAIDRAGACLLWVRQPHEDRWDERTRRSRLRRLRGRYHWESLGPIGQLGIIGSGLDGAASEPEPNGAASEVLRWSGARPRRAWDRGISAISTRLAAAAYSCRADVWASCMQLRRTACARHARAACR